MNLDVSLIKNMPTVVYTSNITHNLNTMAQAAGLYEYLWRPDEIGVFKAKGLIKPLHAGLKLLKSDPERFESMNPGNKWNPRNGWGNYNTLVKFVEDYLAACEDDPDANIEVSR